MKNSEKTPKITILYLVKRGQKHQNTEGNLDKKRSVKKNTRKTSYFNEKTVKNVKKHRKTVKKHQKRAKNTLKTVKKHTFLTRKNIF